MKNKLQSYNMYRYFNILIFFCVIIIYWFYLFILLKPIFEYNY